MSNQTETRKILPFQPGSKQILTVLAVDDDEVERMGIERQMRHLGHNVILAGDGLDALEILKKNPESIDIVLMDWRMPRMDGIAAVRRMKSDPLLRGIPVIMVTGIVNIKNIEEGMEAGAFYYLPKPAEESVLRSVLMAAMQEAKKTRTLNGELSKHRASFGLIETCKFRFRTLAEAECLAPFMAHCYPDPGRVLLGLAEILTNAVEHGNLEIGYQEKSILMNDGKWLEEINKRQETDKYKGRMVEAVITRKDSGIYTVITDEGAGFEWKRYLGIDPTRASDNHGRGIALAVAKSFDKLTYNEAGNQAVAFVSNGQSLQW
ncbi:MAG TPA: response regulator [Micavibrio sp.]